VLIFLHAVQHSRAVVEKRSQPTQLDPTDFKGQQQRRGQQVRKSGQTRVVGQVVDERTRLGQLRCSRLNIVQR